MDVTIFLLFALAMILLYMLPTFVASVRCHQNTVPIAVVNVFLGWTLIGWVGSLAWACTQVVEPQHRRLG